MSVKLRTALLCALGRACGIASRIGFATVSNHLASRKLIEFLGTNLFVYHGYVEFCLENRWFFSGEFYPPAGNYLLFFFDELDVL